MTAMNGDDHPGKRRLILTVFVLLCALVGGYGYLVPGEAQQSGRFYWINSGGAVMFDHATHTTKVGNCADCHHDILKAELAAQCADCHDDDMVADDFSHDELSDIHDYECTRCHDVSQADVTQSCRTCHPSVQDGEPGIVNCSECHDDSYTPESITHDDMTAIEDHTCNSCHVPKSVSDAYHKQCNRCHEKYDKDRFVEADGNAKCNLCHLK